MAIKERGEILTTEQLRAAEEGFAKLLRAKRMSPQFIAEHAEELMAQARREYATWCERGNVAYNPAGWLIVCAWQRTKDLLDAQHRQPRQLAIEEVLHLVDEQTPDPEQVAISHDHKEKIFRALSLLPEKERRLIYLSYFNDLDVKAAGHIVGWQKSAAHRHHDAALDRLRSILGKDFAILDIALSAWALEETDAAPPPTDLFAAAIDAATEAIAIVTQKAAEIWRRLSPLGDPANASLASTGAKVSGACATAVAVACLAGGVIGPGITALKPDTQATHQPSTAKAQPAAPGMTEGRVPVKRAAERKQAQPPGTGRLHKPETERGTSTAAEPALTAARPQSATTTPTPPSSVPQQTNTEFGIENSSSEPSPAVESPSGGGSPAVAASTEAPGSGATPRSTEDAAVAREFGM